MTAPAPAATRAPRTRPGLTWSWTDAARGALYALPAAVAALHNPAHGLALATGALPAAAVGLAPTRRRRLAVVVIGAAVALSMVLGAVLALAPWLAVIGMFVVCLGAGLLAARRRLGLLAMMLCAPLIGVGLSESIPTALKAAALIVAGSAYCCLVCLVWPERPAVPAPRKEPMTAADAYDYALRLACAGASAAAVGLAWAPTHPGWTPAAALLVMRPAAEMQKLRSQGRVASVLLGGVGAGLLVRLHPPNAGYAVAALAALAAATATQRSRWYVLPAFSTFVVLLLLAAGDPADVEARFLERMLATVVGVGLAFVFGLVGRPPSPKAAPTPRDGRPYPQPR